MAYLSLSPEDLFQLSRKSDKTTGTALKAFKDTGDYDVAVREWKALPDVDKTWDKVKKMVTSEYSKY